MTIEELEKIKIAHINDEKYLKTEFDTDYTDLYNLCLSNSESGFGKLREFLVNIWSDGIISNEERKAVDEYVQKSELNYSKASLIIREIRDQYATKDLRSIIAGYGGEVLEWGLWGHYSFAIRDLNEEQVKAAEELKSIVLSDLISIDDFPEVD